MKQTKLLIGIAMALLIGMPALFAQTINHSVRATVPFQFSVGDKTLEAGQYLISSTQEKVITIRNVDNNGFALALSNAVEDFNVVEPKLVFHQYGEKYFLAQVWLDSGVGRGLAEPSSDKRKLADVYRERDVTVIAAK